MTRHQLKIKRLEKAYKRHISEALQFSVGDPRLKESFIRITKVSINQELSKASVFFLIDPEDRSKSDLDSSARKNKAIKALYRSAPFLLNLMKDKVRVRSLPDLKFFYDAKEADAEKVVQLIDRLSKATEKP